MNLRRFYNQNRKSIWRIAIIIAFLLIMLQLLNTFQKRKEEGIKDRINSSNIAKESNNQIQVSSSKSTVTGKQISSSSLKEKTQIITDFLENCNNRKVEEAYKMLTEECKEELYATVSDFRTYYCGNFFNEPRASFEIENWFDDTYKVNIIPDMLSTGKVNDNDKKQDYITIQKVNDEYKLNINSYIGRTKKSDKQEKNGILIKVNYKDVYMDYEKYNLTVKNNKETNIILDTKENVRTMYIEDKNEIIYPAITNEIEEQDLQVNAGEEKTLNIKYYSRYSSTKNISRLVFSNVILNSNKYTNRGEKDETKISINI